MARFAAIAGFAAAALVGAQARAQPAYDPGSNLMPPFPAAVDPTSATLWLKRNTSVGVGRHVVFGADNVLVVLNDEVDPRRTDRHRVSFRQEAVKVDFVSRTGGRSILGSGEVDCTLGTFRADSTEVYVGTDLRGERVSALPAEANGRRPFAGTAAAEMIASVCGIANEGVTTRAANAPSSRSAPSDAEPSAVTAIDPAVLPKPAAAAPRPPAKPPAAAAARPPQPNPVPAKPAAPAEVLAQIGAFASRDAAEKAWDRLLGQFPAQLTGLDLVIEPTQTATGSVFRSSIRGFATPQEAGRFCARMMASSEACFVRRSP